MIALAFTLCILIPRRNHGTQKNGKKNGIYGIKIIKIYNVPLLGELNILRLKAEKLASEKNGV
jgi:hypothetical protein